MKSYILVFSLVVGLYATLLTDAWAKVDAESFAEGSSIDGFTLVQQTLRGGRELQEEQPACPYVASVYIVTFYFLGVYPVTFVFRPSDWGLSPGTYCALSSEALDVKYTFDNCTCGVARACDPTSTTVSVPILGFGTTEFQVNTCELESWVYIVPAVLGVSLILGVALCVFIGRR